MMYGMSGKKGVLYPEQRRARFMVPIEAYLSRYGLPVHHPDDGCRGCHKASVLRDLLDTTSDFRIFRMFLRFAMNAK